MRTFVTPVSRSCEEWVEPWQAAVQRENKKLVVARTMCLVPWIVVLLRAAAFVSPRTFCTAHLAGQMCQTSSFL